MSVDVVTEIIIERPREKVAEFASNPDNAPRWYVNIKTVEWETERPVRLGSRVSFVAHFLGRRLAYTYEVVEFTPGERLKMRTTQGPFPMETTYTWEALSPTRTRMRLRNQGSPSGFSSLVAPFMAMAMRRANRKDLELLKRTLQNGLN